jgi:hypothetical protein
VRWLALVALAASIAHADASVPSTGGGHGASLDACAARLRRAQAAAPRLGDTSWLLRRSLLQIELELMNHHGDTTSARRIMRVAVDEHADTQPPPLGWRSAGFGDQFAIQRLVPNRGGSIEIMHLQAALQAQLIEVFMPAVDDCLALH